MLRRPLAVSAECRFYFMMRDSEPGNAQVGAARKAALIGLPNCVGESTLDEVTCWF